MNRSAATPGLMTRIDGVARSVILEALEQTGRTTTDVARLYGITTAAMSRRLRGNRQDGKVTFYSWTLGELVALSNWLGVDILSRIAEESRRASGRAA